MADASPVDPNVIYPAPRPLTPIWSRRWVGFPARHTSLVGREREVATVRELLREPGRRLVTLTGPGGVGKTRLAMAAAEEVAPTFADGAAFVDLSAISDPALILPAIARVLEVRESPGRSLRETLLAALRERHLLLVLDNFEHLAGAAAAADLAALLDACPAVTVLVTSRTPLHLHDEQRFTTPALALPSSPATDPAALAEFGAIALFIARARLAHHDFALTTENAPAVVETCHRLNGLPLAIELAAAWARVLTPAALLARLEPSLPLLRGGAEDQPARLRTMRDAIAWSYDLLRADEQQCFRRLAVFAGGFTMAGAEAVSAHVPSPHHPITPSLSSDTLDLLASLIDKSLLQQTEADGGEPRFSMLETVREFGLERLAETGETEAVTAAHAAHYLALAEAAAAAAGGASGSGWMRRLAAERPNLRAALDWLDTRSQSAAVLQMTGALWHYWYRLGDLAEGRTRLERALTAAPREVDPLLRARALRGAGVLAWQSADYDQSRERLEAALAAYGALGDRAGTAWVLNSLGCLFATLSAAEPAETNLTESLAIFRTLGDAVGMAQLTANLGELAQVEGRHELAVERLESALAMWRDLGGRTGAARAQVYLAQALLARGELTQADAVLLEALTTIHDIEYEQILPAALRTVAHLAARRGAGALAARWYG
ncbi:MAG: ATP-binding protein, partial [Thermomicrobiales bacterium]